MPSWLIDLGRYAGSFVLICLGMVCASAAMWPCIMIAQYVYGQTSLTIAVMLIPFLYILWGWCFALLIIFIKRFVLWYRPREQRFPLYSATTISWAITGCLHTMIAKSFLQFWKGTPFLNMYFRAMGCHLGRRVTINTVEIWDWDLITLQDDAMLGGNCIINGHLFEHGQLLFRPVIVGPGALVGAFAYIMPGVHMGERSVLAVMSMAKKGEQIAAQEIWGGVPAAYIKTRK